MSGPIQDYVSLDLETTGLTPRYDRIIEIGAVKVKGGRIVEEFTQLVNPGRILGNKTRELTGIRDSDLLNAPDLDAVLPGFLSFGEELPLLGHSILFDYTFIKRAAVNRKMKYERSGIDTLKLARRFLPDLESRRLADLCIHFGFEHQAHRALGDALAAHRLYEKLCELYWNEDDFAPHPLLCRVKREGPVSRQQKERLYRLTQLHRLAIDVDIEKLTKNEADRMIDRILAQFGTLQK